MAGPGTAFEAVDFAAWGRLTVGAQAIKQATAKGASVGQRIGADPYNRQASTELTDFAAPRRSHTARMARPLDEGTRKGTEPAASPLRPRMRRFRSLGSRGSRVSACRGCIVSRDERRRASQFAGAAQAALSRQ